ncbi:MAG: hypothetical protein J6A52_00520 [Bacilli bacterium]|nr:hypothetical protein [Bacilli bacterium]
MFDTFTSFLNVDFCSFFNLLNIEGFTFTDFLNLLKSVVLMFLDYFVMFCNMLLNNWFILVIIGFSLFVSITLIVFDFIDISFLKFNNSNIDTQIDRSSDKKNKRRIKS